METRNLTAKKLFPLLLALFLAPGPASLATAQDDYEAPKQIFKRGTDRPEKPTEKNNRMAGLGSSAKKSLLPTKGHSNELAKNDYARPYESSSLLSQPTAEVLNAGEIHFGGSGVINKDTEDNLNGEFVFGLGGVAEISTSIRSMADNIQVGKENMPVAALKIQLFPGTKKIPLKAAILVDKSFSGSQRVSFEEDNANPLTYGVSQTNYHLMLSYRFNRLALNLGGKLVGQEVTRGDSTVEGGNDMSFHPMVGLKLDVNKNTQIITELEGAPFLEYTRNPDRPVEHRRQFTGQLGVRYFVLTWVSIDAATATNYVLNNPERERNFLNRTQLKTRLNVMIPTQVVVKRIVNQFK